MPNAKVIPFDGDDRGRPAKSRARAGLEVDEEQPDVYSMVEEFEESPELGRADGRSDGVRAPSGHR